MIYNVVLDYSFVSLFLPLQTAVSARRLAPSMLSSSQTTWSSRPRPTKSFSMTRPSFSPTVTVGSLRLLAPLLWMLLTDKYQGVYGQRKQKQKAITAVKRIMLLWFLFYSNVIGRGLGGCARESYYTCAYLFRYISCITHSWVL